MIAKGRTGKIEFDGRLVTITRTRLVSRITVGKGEKRIPIESISAVQLKPAGWVLNGYIQFTISGGNEVRARFGSQTYTAALDENSVTFDFLRRRQFRKLFEEVQAAITKPSISQRNNESLAASTKLDQLKQLGDLRSAGVLSADEFESAKRKILAE